MITCKTAEKEIASYLNGTLASVDALELLHHVQECPQCHEELTIQYLVSVGLNDLDDCDNLDVDSMIKRSKHDLMHTLHVEDIAERLLYGLIFFGIFFISFAILLFLF